MNIKNERIKNLARKVLLKNANFKPNIQELISPLGADILAEKTFYFGRKRFSGHGSGYGSGSGNRGNGFIFITTIA